MAKKRKNNKTKCLSVSTKAYKKATKGRTKQWVSGYYRDGVRVKRYYRRKPR